MTFTEIQTEIAERMHLTSTDALARIGRRINERYKRLTSSLGMQTSRSVITSATTTIGVRTLEFVGVEKLISVSDRSTGRDRYLKEVFLEELQRFLPVDSFPAKRYAIYRVGPNSVTIYLDCEPTTSYTLYAHAIEDLSTLSGSMVPSFPESFHDILVFGVMADEYTKMEKPALAMQAEKDFESRLSDLRMFIAKSAMQDIYQGKMVKTRWWGDWVGTGGGGGSAPVEPEGCCSDIDGTAGEAIAVNKVVYLANDGKWYLADGSSSTSSSDALFVGMSTGSAAADSSTTFRLIGRIDDLSGLTPGTTYYVSDTAGELSSTPGSNERVVGIAVAIGSIVIGGDVPTDLSNLNASNLTSGTVPDARFPATLPAVSGANLTNLDASDLASGTVPLARLSGITNTQIDNAAAIAWTKISKTGSSLADLTTRSAGDLSSGTVLPARLGGVTADGNSGTSKTIDLSLNIVHTLTLTGNVTLTFSNPTDGQRFVLKVVQGSGPYTITWPGTVAWPGAVTPTLTATNGRTDIFVFVYISADSKYYGTYTQNYT